MKTFSFFVAACSGLLIQAGFAGAHASSAGAHCPGMTVTDSVTSDALNGTNSTNWVNAIDGERNFTTSSTGCAIVAFTATGEVYPVSPNHEFLHARILLDNKSTCALPYSGDVLMGSADSEFTSTNSITRICEHVPAGVHTVQVQYRSGGGADVDMYGHTLTVTHN